MTTSTIAKSALVRPAVSIEHPIHVGPQCILQGGQIGRYCFVNAGTIIFDGTDIGRFTTFARNCHIGGVEHPIHHLSTSFFRISRNWFPDDPLAQTAPLIKNTPPPERKRGNRIKIGNDVWFGAGAIVLKGLEIGDGAVIGAGAVVTSDVPPYAIVAGNPARVLRLRFEEAIVKDLLRSRWWDRDPEFLATLPLDDVKACLAALEKDEAPAPDATPPGAN